MNTTKCLYEQTLKEVITVILIQIMLEVQGQEIGKIRQAVFVVYN